MSFREVLELGVHPEGVVREYNSRRYKGGMGNLLEERFFGYRANSDREPDFSEAGVELKATCIDRRKNGSDVAGERLVLTMISYDEEAPASLYDSHLWHKCRSILLVWYRRDRSIDPYDQRIERVLLFTPPERDLLVIEYDYSLITGLVRDGRADELSESLTSYLGACTKGATAEKSMRDQARYAPGKRARARAFSYKQSYMNYVLHHYVMGEPEAESVVKDPRELERQSLEQYVTRIINAHVGESDRDLCRMLDIDYTGNKAQWTIIAYRLLGVRGDRAAEFEKAGIRVRTLRPESDGRRLVESAPILNIDFLALAAERDWEDSELRNLLADMRYLLVVFQKDGERTVLRGCKVWGMPERDLDGPVRECWKRTRNAVLRGVKLTPRVNTKGKVSYSNDFPKISDDIVAHVRPRASQAAYRLEDGTIIGNIERDAEELPDHRWMTRQAFWLNNSYLLKQISDLPSLRIRTI
jgi:DNA mismatch repair protein MutH